MDTTKPSFQKILLSLFGCGLLLLAGMNLLPNAATTIWQIRWYPMHLCSIFLVTVGCCGLFFRKPGVRANSLLLVTLLGLISLGLLLSAFIGPFPTRSLVYSLPVFSVIFCGTVGLLTVKKTELESLAYSGAFQASIAVYICLWSGLSLYHFFSKEVMPLFQMAKILDIAAEGGLYDLILESKLPQLRNGYPFGHANYNSGFMLLCLPLLFYGLRFPASKILRWISLLALLLGLGVLMSTQSRNALLGLGFATAMGILWLGEKRKKILPLLVGLGLGFVLILLSVPRFQKVFFEISPGRWGIWKSAGLTGVEYFPFGCGEGLAPEMLQYFSPQLSASWGNMMQFHHTWLHLWAVGGVLALAGIGGITIWIFIKILFPGNLQKDQRFLSAPSVMALSASLVVFFSDYQLDIFPIALLLFFHLVVFAVVVGKEHLESVKAARLAKILLLVPILALGGSLTRIPASIQSRQAVEIAGQAYEDGNLSGSVSGYLKSFEALPEPYALNMAGILFAQKPETHPEAIELFNQSLEMWEAQTLVHEFLVYIWMRAGNTATEPEQQRVAFEKALHHARRRVEISPQLKGVYLDVAIILEKLNYPEAEITEALLFETLMQGDLLFPVSWDLLGDLQVYRPRVIQKLWSADGSESSAISNRIKLLQGYLYLMNEDPTASEISPEVIESMQRRIDRPGELQLLNNYCLALPEEKSAEMKRLLVYVFSSPISDDEVAGFIEAVDPELSCFSALLNFGQPRLQFNNFQGVGISARHPLTVPVNRPRLYADVFGTHFLPPMDMKTFKPEEYVE